MPAGGIVEDGEPGVVPAGGTEGGGPAGGIPAGGIIPGGSRVAASYRAVETQLCRRGNSESQKG